MSKIKLSFIVPVYNVEDYLPQCIESILAQTNSSWELILVNDGSRDGCAVMCDDYAAKDSRITAMHQENSGVAAARNAGLAVAQGEWVCFVDSDDWVSARLLEKCLQAVEQDTEICFFQHKETTGENCEVSLPQTPVLLERDAFKLFLHGAFNKDMLCDYDFYKVKLATPCKVYRRAFIKQCGAEFPQGLRSGEDLLFNLQLYAHAKKGCYLPEELYFHRIWQGSVSHGFSFTAPQDYQHMTEKLKAFIETLPCPEQYERDWEAKAVINLGFSLVLHFCHKTNEQSYTQRKAAYSAYVAQPLFVSALRNVRPSDFCFKKSILVCLIKWNQFWVIDCLCSLGIA